MKQQSMHRPSLEELPQLSVEDRLQLAEDIWTTLEEEKLLPLPEWQEAELNRRLKAFEEDGSQGMQWDGFHKGLREEAGERFKADAMAAWSAYRASGEHITGEEADAWLARLEAGEDCPPPEPHQ